MRGRIVDFALSLTGKQRLTLELDDDFRGQFDELHEHDVEVIVKRFRERRSLDANGYAWVLIGKIAARMRLPKNEVYRDHIRTIGGTSETVCVLERAVDKMTQAWEKNGLGWQVEPFPSKIPGCVNMTLYYGSSVYDTRQMSDLIDSLVQTCKSLGIETMPPDQLEQLVGGEHERVR